MTRYQKYKNSYIEYRKKHPEVFKRGRDNYLFGGNRITVMSRDGYKCVDCGMTNEEHIKKWGRELCVHHINGRGKRVKKEEKDSRLQNLQTLCFPCHHKKELKFKHFAYGETHPRAKLLDREVAGIRKVYSTGKYSLPEVARKFNTTAPNVWYIVNYVSRKKLDYL